jgi:hypothetical protein
VGIWDAKGAACKTVGFSKGQSEDLRRGPLPNPAIMRIKRRRVPRSPRGTVLDGAACPSPFRRMVITGVTCIIVSPLLDGGDRSTPGA